MTTKHNQQHPIIIDVDHYVFILILVASSVAFGYWWGAESQIEVKVIRIPERVTPACIQKGALKKMLFEYRKDVK